MKLNEKEIQVLAKGTKRLDSEMLEVETPEEIADELAQIFKEADWDV